jgi:hypothetical protein
LKKAWEEIIGPKVDIFSNYPNMQLFIMHVIQSYHIQFEMKLHALPEKYTDNNQRNAFIMLNHREWYDNICRMVKICLDNLLRGQEKFNREMKKYLEA